MSNRRSPPDSRGEQERHLHEYAAGSSEIRGMSRRSFLHSSATGLAAGTLAGSGLAGTALATDFDHGRRGHKRGRRILLKGGP